MLEIDREPARNDRHQAEHPEADDLLQVEHQEYGRGRLCKQQADQRHAGEGGEQPRPQPPADRRDQHRQQIDADDALDVEQPEQQADDQGGEGHDRQREAEAANFRRAERQPGRAEDLAHEIGHGEMLEQKWQVANSESRMVMSATRSSLFAHRPTATPD
jgi:hypothetical protein